jgi:hypothetical protein
MKKMIILASLIAIIFSAILASNNANASCQGYVYLENESKYAYINATNGTNTSITEGGGSNCYQIESAVHNMLTGLKMNENASSNLNSYIAQQQEIQEKLAQQYAGPSLNQSKTMQIIKPYMANAIRAELEQNRANYIAQTTDVKLAVLLTDMSVYHQQRINALDRINETLEMNPWTANWSSSPLQNYTAQQPNAPPSTYYVPPLKPEFAKYPTGWLNRTSVVTDWTSLQKWMMNQPINSTSLTNSTNGTK